MKRFWAGLTMAVALFVLIVAVVFAGLLPLVMPLGLAAGGVLETGQVAPARWWLAAGVAIALFLLASWRMDRRARRWWLGVLVAGIVSAVLVFGWRASRDMPDTEAAINAGGRPGAIGLMTALPLFWAEDAAPDRNIGGRSPLVDHLHARAVDHIDGASLRGLDVLILAQPRLLQPTELVALDGWIRRGGRAVIFADPLLVWPSDLPLGDPRRAPLTSLLDPLMLHWGLLLAPAAKGADGVDRRMLSTGHMLMLAGASRFLPSGKTACTFTDDGLMALCPIGKGRVRLIADADLLDQRLWLADARWAERRQAYASDIVPLLDSWVADPLGLPVEAAPRRATDDAALISGLRRALLAALVWAGLGWLGQRRIMPAKGAEKREANSSGASG